MEYTASDSHTFLAFWRPRTVPRMPGIAAGHVVVPIVTGLNSITFPKLSLTIQPTNTISAQNVLGIQYALSSLATGIGKAYLVCRNIFVLLAFLSLVYGIVECALGNAAGVLPIVMTVFWMGMSRLMANRLILSLGEGEVAMETKVRELSRSYLGDELEVKFGRCMQWVEVMVPGYRPPAMNVVSGVPVPMGVPI